MALPLLGQVVDTGIVGGWTAGMGFAVLMDGRLHDPGDGPRPAFEATIGSVVVSSTAAVGDDPTSSTGRRWVYTVYYERFSPFVATDTTSRTAAGQPIPILDTVQGPEAPASGGSSAGGLVGAGSSSAAGPPPAQMSPGYTYEETSAGYRYGVYFDGAVMEYNWYAETHTGSYAWTVKGADGTVLASGPHRSDTRLAYAVMQYNGWVESADPLPAAEVVLIGQQLAQFLINVDCFDCQQYVMNPATSEYDHTTVVLTWGGGHWKFGAVTLPFDTAKIRRLNWETFGWDVGTYTVTAELPDDLSYYVHYTIGHGLLAWGTDYRWAELAAVTGMGLGSIAADILDNWETPALASSNFYGAVQTPSAASLGTGTVVTMHSQQTSWDTGHRQIGMESMAGGGLVGNALGNPLWLKIAPGWAATQTPDLSWGGYHRYYRLDAAPDLFLGAQAQAARLDPAAAAPGWYPLAVKVRADLSLLRPDGLRPSDFVALGGPGAPAVVVSEQAAKTVVTCSGAGGGVRRVLHTGWWGSGVAGVTRFWAPGDAEADGTGFVTWNLAPSRHVTLDDLRAGLPFKLEGQYDGFVNTKHISGDDVWWWGTYGWMDVTLALPGTDTDTTVLTMAVEYEDVVTSHKTDTEDPVWRVAPDLSCTYAIPARGGTHTYRVDLLFPAEGWTRRPKRVRAFEILGLPAGETQILGLLFVVDGDVKLRVGRGWPGVDGYSVLELMVDGAFGMSQQAGFRGSEWQRSEAGYEGGSIRDVEVVYDSTGHFWQPGPSVLVSDLANRLNELEGVVATYDATARSVANTDEFGHTLFPNPEPVEWLVDALPYVSFAAGVEHLLQVSPGVVGLSIGSVVPHRVQAVKAVHGGVCGLAGDGLTRAPGGTVGLVQGGDVVATGTADGQGWVCFPDLAINGQQSFELSNNPGWVLTPGPRELPMGGLPPVAIGDMCIIERGMLGRGYRYVSDGGVIREWVYRTSVPQAPGSSEEVALGRVAFGVRPCAERDDSGVRHLWYERGGGLYYAVNRGDGWGAETMVLAGYTPMATRYVEMDHRVLMLALHGGRAKLLRWERASPLDGALTVNEAGIVDLGSASAARGGGLEWIANGVLQAWWLSNGYVITVVSSDMGRTWQAAG